MNGAEDTFMPKKIVRTNEGIHKEQEVKATKISNKSKGKLYRSLNQTEKFGIIVHQKSLSKNIFLHKKTKQRYLDWAYKLSVKRKFEKMIAKNMIDALAVEELHFYIDSHTTATNGTYELHESLEQEFKIGTHGADWKIFHPPIFPNLKKVNVRYCDSKSNTLVRAADIISNRLYYLCINGKTDQIDSDMFNVIHHP